MHYGFGEIPPPPTVWAQIIRILVSFSGWSGLIGPTQCTPLYSAPELSGFLTLLLWPLEFWTFWLRKTSKTRSGWGPQVLLCLRFQGNGSHFSLPSSPWNYRSITIQTPSYPSKHKPTNQIWRRSIQKCVLYCKKCEIAHHTSYTHHHFPKYNNFFALNIF